MNNPEQRPKDDGYSVFHYSHSPSQGGDKNAYLRWLAAEGHTYKQVKRLPWKDQFPLHQTTWCCDRAIDFFRANKDRPWLFSINVYDPHPPLDPPPDFAQRFDIEALPGPLWRASDLEQKTVFEEIMFQSKPQRIDPRDGRMMQAKYWAMVEMIDENVGRLMNALNETGQRRNTVVVFASDHGNMTGDHGLRAKGCRFYEGLVRVPLIFWAPERFQPNLRSDALVDLADIAPTLMEIATGKSPDRMQGKSLLPILTGEADPHTHKDAVRCEFYSCVGPSPSSTKWPDSYGTMFRTRQYKISVYHGIERGELFDMEKDPGEFQNLWDDAAFGEVREEMLRACFEATVAANLPNMPIMTNAEEARRKAKAAPQVRFTSLKENGVWTSHYEDGEYRLVVRHGADRGGALCDLTSPEPKRNRWDDPDCRELRSKLLKQCFDAFVFSIDLGPERIGRY